MNFRGGKQLRIDFVKCISFSLQENNCILTLPLVEPRMYRRFLGEPLPGAEVNWY